MCRGSTCNSFHSMDPRSVPQAGTSPALTSSERFTQSLSSLGGKTPVLGETCDCCGGSGVEVVTRQVAHGRGSEATVLSPPETGSLDKSAKPNQRGSGEQGERLQSARETMEKRARSKYITADLLRELDELDSPVPYHHAFDCSKMVEQHDGQLTTKYCKCRWCIVCNRIRTAKRIDRYEPVFREWMQEGGVQFVTLTVPNVPGQALDATLDEMMHKLKLCRRSIRRTRGLDYRAVRSIEVTYNRDRGDYHPHFHLAVPGRTLALALRDEWLKRWDSATRSAQDVRRWDGRTGSLKELTKYCTKLVAPAEEETMPAEALDVIFRALHGRHLFRPVGFDLADVGENVTWEDIEAIDDLESSVPAWSYPNENRLWWWDEAIADWVDPDTGECLTGWSPSPKDRRMRGLDPPSDGTKGPG